MPAAICVYGSTGAAHYLLAGKATEIFCIAVGLGMHVYPGQMRATVPCDVHAVAPSGDTWGHSQRCRHRQRLSTDALKLTASPAPTLATSVPGLFHVCGASVKPRPQSNTALDVSCRPGVCHHRFLLPTPAGWNNDATASRNVHG